MTISANPCVHWEFRWNQDSAPPSEEIADFLKTYCSDWGFQLEQGDGGLLHFQGHLRLVKKRRDPHKLFLGTFQKEPNYLAPTCNNTLSLMENGIGQYYGMKADTRIEGPWIHDPCLNNVDLYDVYDIGNRLTAFQKIWLDMLDEQTTREIAFIYGQVGGVGKSTFGMWLYSTRPRTVVVPATMESAEDMLQWVYAFTRPGKDNQATIILDIPRSLTGENSWHKFLTALEDIKRGYVYDKRYNAKAKLIYPPRIIVFSNKEPPKGLTGDRFVLMDVDEFIASDPDTYQCQVMVRSEPRRVTPASIRKS